MRHLLSIILCLWASCSWAFPPWFIGAVTHGASSGTVYTDCSNAGTASLYWTGEHTSGTTYACINTTTTLNAASLSGTIVASGTDPGTSSPASGGNVVKILGSQVMEYTITGTDIFDYAEGIVSIDVYLSASTGANRIFYARGVASTDSFEVYIDSANKVIVKHIGNSVEVKVSSDDTVSDSTWTNVQARWDVELNRLSVKVGGGSWKEANDSDPLTSWATTGKYVRFPGGVSSDTIYTDNTTVYKDSGL